MRIPSGKIDQVIYFVAVDSTDLKTRKTGLSGFTVYRSRNGGVATVYTTPTVTELSAANMPGVYALLVDEDTTIAATSDSEEMLLHITVATMAPVSRAIELYRRDTTTGRTLAVDATSHALADLDTIKTNPVVNAGTATFPTNATLASTTNITAGTITTATNVTTVNGLAADVITAAATAPDFTTEIQAGLATSAALATVQADTDDIQTRLPAALVGGRMDSSVGAMAAGVITAASTAADFSTEIANTVWNEPIAGHLAAGSTGLALNSAGAAGDPWLTALPGAYGAGTAGNIVGNNLDATVSSRASAANLAIVAGYIDTEVAAILADTTNIKTRLPAALTAGGNIKTDSLYANGAVWFDQGGSPGTVQYVNGTSTNPSSSMANARTLADALNLKTFQVVGNNTNINLDQGYVGYAFQGSKWSVALSNRAITNTYFSGADVTGLSTGTGASFEDCVVGSATINADASFRRCGLSGTITFGGSGIYSFFDCYTKNTAGTNTTLDYGAFGATTVGMRSFAGGFTLENMSGGDVFACVGGGQVTIGASCNGGTVILVGPINLVNNGTGVTIIDDARWDEDQNITNVTGTINGLTVAALSDFFDTNSGQTYGTAVAGSVVKEIADNAIIPADVAVIAGAVWDEPVDDGVTARQSMRLQNSAMGGKASGLGTTTAIYRSIDDTKNRITATVDVDGNRTAVVRDLS